MDDQSYNEIPDTSRTTTSVNDTSSKFTVRLTIQVADIYDLYVMVDEEEYVELTVDHLKFRIK